MKIDSARATARKDTLGHVQYPWRTALRVQESTLGSTATTDVGDEARAWMRNQISEMINTMMAMMFDGRCDALTKHIRSITQLITNLNS